MSGPNPGSMVRGPGAGAHVFPACWLANTVNSTLPLASAPMLDSVKKYVYERRGGLVKTAAIVGGAYLVRGYVGERLEEVKTRLEQQRAAEEGCVQYPSR